MSEKQASERQHVPSPRTDIIPAPIIQPSHPRDAGVGRTDITKGDPGYRGARNLAPPSWNQVERIVDLAKVGLSIKTISKLTRIPHGRIQQWLREGEDEQLPDTDARRSLARRVELAEQERLTTYVKTVATLASSDEIDANVRLRAATWLLEREDPDTYNLKNRIEHSGAVDMTHHAGMTTRELHEELHAEYRRLKAENEGSDFEDDLETRSALSEPRGSEDE